MDRFAAMSVFARVVELGSFARAAERLDLSTSAVSRHVADLESHLQTRLLNRTTRKLSLTEGGHAFYERCVQVLADLEEAEQAAAHTSLVPRGTIKLTCGLSFGMLHLRLRRSFHWGICGRGGSGGLGHGCAGCDKCCDCSCRQKVPDHVKLSLCMFLCTVASGTKLSQGRSGRDLHNPTT